LQRKCKTENSVNFIFSGKWEDTDIISAPNALVYPAHGCKSTVLEPLT
jgi:hypothetical protein